MVKADAYGLGAGEVARALWRAGCEQFFVAHADEGLSLRTVLADAEIYVLHGLPGEEAAVIEAGLIPVLNHPGELQRHVDAGAPARAAPAGGAACRQRHVAARLRRGRLQALDHGDARRARPAPGDEPSGLCRGARQPDERAAAGALRAAARLAAAERRRASPTPRPSSWARRSTTSSAGRASRSTASIRPRAAPIRWRPW